MGDGGIHSLRLPYVLVIKRRSFQQFSNYTVFYNYHSVTTYQMLVHSSISSPLHKSARNAYFTEEEMEALKR